MALVSHTAFFRHVMSIFCGFCTRPRGFERGFASVERTSAPRLVRRYKKVNSFMKTRKFLYNTILTYVIYFRTFTTFALPTLLMSVSELSFLCFFFKLFFNIVSVFVLFQLNTPALRQLLNQRLP